ncbi:DUF748 domain-containing protein [Desulfuromonas carbonis]|uniref:DUF748 domain-containing protein n=1 Tax=Desulfuromonas sp. DDH964 TaxID=1823759 RepID=UPI00078EB366|nr:DUF748 domain-containing protein [Desulfuromonas sp. DDH964]AMV71228.1 flagellar motor protein MotB [Desulfuromonas sp. DDH964]
MSRWKKIVASLAILVVLLLLAITLFLPGQLRSRASAWVADQTGRSLSIGAIGVNPLTLTLTIRDLDLKEPGSEQSFFSCQRLLVSLSSRSLLERALILDAVELDQPYLLLQRTGPERFNFSDLIPANDPAAPPVPAAEPLRFSINNLVVRAGSVDLADLTREDGGRHTIRQFDLSVPVIGNVPYLADRYVEPALSLRFDDSPLRAEGRSKPFSESEETTLALKLQDLDLAHYARYSPVPLPLTVATGRLALDIEASYRLSAAKTPQLLLNGSVVLSGLNLDFPDGTRCFTLPLLSADIDFIDLAERQLALRELSIYSPELYLDRNRTGEWNFERLLPQRTGEMADAAAPATAAPELRVAIETLRLRLGKVHFRDALPPGGFSEEIREINLLGHDFSNLADDRGDFSFGLETERRLRLAISGTAGLIPLAARAEFKLEDLPLAPYYPYLADRLTAPVSGRFGTAGEVDYGPQPNQLQLRGVTATLAGVDAPFGGGDHFALSSLALAGGHFDLATRTTGFADLDLEQAELVASRQADGHLTPFDLLRPQPAAPAPVPAATTDPESPPWQVTLGRVALAGSRVQFRDATLPREGVLELEDLHASIANLTLPQAGKSPYQLGFRLGKGELNLAGELVHTPLAVNGTLQIAHLPLPDLSPWFPALVKVDFVDGRLDSHLQYHLRQKETGLGGTISGAAGIRRLALHDPLAHEPLLAWESLQLDGLRVDLQPLQVEIAGVALNNYQAQVLVTKDGRVNLASVANAAAAEAPATTLPAAAPEPAPSPRVQITRVTLQDGTLTFTDHHLPEFFATTMYRLGGRITGLASDAKAPAAVDLRGELENRSPLQISGSIDPFRDSLYLDLKVTFSNIDLVPATPYAGTYLGYVIAKGKLFLNLDYHIEDHQVTASNQLFLDQFSFGDAVASDAATSLPVRLAVALLKDRNGEIHLDLPVSGRTDDPQFQIWSTLFTIVKNLLVKAATAPFSLLAAMLGGGADGDFSQVTFPFGSAALTAAAQEKLAKLAQALQQRPALKLEISGFVDPDQDPEGYRQLQLQQRLIAFKRRELAGAGKEPSPAGAIEIGREEYPRLLRQVYKQAKFPKPRNFLGFEKDLPVAEMEKLLLANIPAGPQQLQELASARAEAVQTYLQQQGSEIGPRLFLKNAPIEQPPAKAGEAASRVEFGLSLN